MEQDDPVSGAPIAGSPEVRDIVSTPLGIAEVAAPPPSDADVDFDEMAHELTHGLIHPKTDQF